MGRFDFQLLQVPAAKSCTIVMSSHIAEGWKVVTAKARRLHRIELVILWAKPGVLERSDLNWMTKTMETRRLLKSNLGLV